MPKTYDIPTKDKGPYELFEHWLFVYGAESPELMTLVAHQMRAAGYAADEAEAQRMAIAAAKRWAAKKMTAGRNMLAAADEYQMMIEAAAGEPVG